MHINIYLDLDIDLGLHLERSRLDKFSIDLKFYLEQWFLTMLEVPNPTGFIRGFTEPLFLKKYDFFKFKTDKMFFTGSIEPLRSSRQTPRGRSNPS